MNQEVQDTLFPECCHSNPVEILERNGPHFARRVCPKCRKFLGWVPKPETIRQRQENTVILTELSKIETLPEWERRFVRSVASHINISPKQQATLNLLRDTYLRKEDQTP